jgi:hypothetical protein
MHITTSAAVLWNLEPDRAAAEDGRGPARLGRRARELVIARVEAGVAVEGEAAGAEDDAVLGQHRRAEARVSHARRCKLRLVRGVRKTGRSWCRSILKSKKRTIV